jgi:hypothetical protein
MVVANNEDDNDGLGRGLQYPQPMFGSREQSEFVDVLRLLEQGQIAPEQAQKRLMTFYQMGMGAWIRALGEIKPEMVSEIVGKLSKDLDLISGHYDPKQQAIGATQQVSSNYRLSNKTIETLLRERVILHALVGTNQSLPSAEIRKLIEKTDPTVKMPTITANLDRLWKIQQINRPRKGYYASSTNSQSYLSALESEIEARGLDVPPLDAEVN